MQDPWYRDGVAAILGVDDPDDVDFMFGVVQTAPPYLVQVYRVSPSDVDRGRDLNRIATEIYRDCTETGTWPAWSEDITELSLTGYARQRIERTLNAWHGISYDY
jgi:hypothetical protein